VAEARGRSTQGGSEKASRSEYGDKSAPSSAGLNDYCESPRDGEIDHSDDIFSGIHVSGLSESQTKVLEIVFSRIDSKSNPEGPFVATRDTVRQLAIDNADGKEPKELIQAEPPKYLPLMVSSRRGTCSTIPDANPKLS